MQIHNPVAGETLFAINRWGGGGGGTASGDLAVGIGNNQSITNNDPDYTFSYVAPSFDLVRRLHVLVLPEVGAPALVEANGSANLDRLIVTFDREITEASAIPGNFTLDGGITVTGATLLPGNTEIALTTTVQTPATLYAVSASGIQARSGGGVILPDASAQVTA